MAQSHEPTVHPGSDTGVAHLGVHGVGEVDRRRPLGHGHDLALGCEHVDLVLLQVDLEGLHELGGVGGLLLPVHDPVEPGQLVGGRTDLVGKVGGHPELRSLVHLPGPQLDLEGLSQRAHHRRVQGLVEVELGHRHVVLEPTLHRPPGGVDRTERGVAVLHRFDEHPDADQVVDVVELTALDHHLLVDAPQVLRATRDLSLHPELAKTLPHLLEHLGQIQLPLRSPGGDHVVDLGVLLRVEGGEAQVFELLLELLHTEAVSERRVHVERLPGDAGLGLRRHGAEGPHVVEAVGQFDHQDPEVLGHGHQHLAHRRRLLSLLGVEAEPVQLGDAVHDAGHIGTEAARQLLQSDTGVLHRVVQKGGRDRHFVQAQLGHDLGHRQRMLDVGLSGSAGLTGMGAGGQVVGLGYQRSRGLGLMGTECRQQRGQLHRSRRARATPWQDPADGGHEPSLGNRSATHSVTHPDGVDVRRR